MILSETLPSFLWLVILVGRSEQLLLNDIESRELRLDELIQYYEVGSYQELMALVLFWFMYFL